METEKIIITSDECDRVTPIPPCEPTITIDVSETEESRGSWKGAVLGVIIASFAIAVVGMVGYCIFGPGGQGPAIEHIQIKTVEQYKSECVKSLNSQLGNPNDALRKFIENAHLTVTVTDAYVLSCEVTTLDGSSSAGENDSNIHRVEAIIRFGWDGIIDKGGHSDLKLVIDAQTKQIKDSKIINTTAAINVEDPEFWFQVGELLGLAIFG